MQNPQGQHDQKSATDSHKTAAKEQPKSGNNANATKKTDAHSSAHTEVNAQNQKQGQSKTSDTTDQSLLGTETLNSAVDFIKTNWKMLLLPAAVVATGVGAYFAVKAFRQADDTGETAKSDAKEKSVNPTLHH